MTSTQPGAAGSFGSGGWSYSAPGGGGPRRRPSGGDLHQTLLRIAAALSVLLILVVVNAVLHGGDDNPLNPIATAAERTQAKAGARSEIEAVYTSADLAQPVTATGHGIYNGQTGRSRNSLSVRVPDGELRVIAVGDPKTIFLRSRLFARELPPGREWMAIDAQLGRSSDTGFGGNGDARSELEMLRAAAGDVVAVADEEVRGVATTRYRGSIDLQRYATNLRAEGEAVAAEQYERLAREAPMPTRVEAWVDDEQVLRRTRITMTLPSRPGDAPMQMDMWIEFYDFGIEPQIQLPDPADVFDSTPLVRGQLGLLTERAAAAALPKPSGAVLQPPVLRTRANAICRSMAGKMHELEGAAKRQLRGIKAQVRANPSPQTVLRAERRLATVLLEPALRIGDRHMRELARLAPPARDAADYRRFLSASQLGLELVRAETRAVQVGEFKLAKRLASRNDPVGNRSDRYAKRLGLDACVDERGDGGGTTAAVAA